MRWGGCGARGRICSSLPGGLGIMSPGIMTGVGGASLDWDRRWRVTPVQTASQEAIVCLLTEGENPPSRDLRDRPTRSGDNKKAPYWGLLIFVFVFWLTGAHPAVAVVTEFSFETEASFAALPAFVPISNPSKAVANNPRSFASGRVRCSPLRSNFGPQSRNCGEIVWLANPVEKSTEFTHHTPLYWFPWALLASPFVGTFIAWFFVWRGELWS